MYGSNDADDAVEVLGLSSVLEEEGELPIMELKVRANGHGYRASILTADGEWALSMREEGGTHLRREEAMYATQGEAIVAAMLAALDAATRTL